MSEVMYYELGTKELQVVPRASLFPINNYEQVERLSTWGNQGVTAFKLIDIGGNKNFMSMPLSQKLETTNKHLATLHWDDNIPPHLKKDRCFWVGPIDTYVWRDKPVPRYLNEAEQSGPSNRFQQLKSSNDALQSALTGTLPHAVTSMPPLQLELPEILQQRFNDLIISRQQYESSTAPLQLEPSTPLRQAGPLMPPFEYKPPTASKQSDLSTALQKSGSSTVHTKKPGSSSAGKDCGPPAAPGKPDSSKAHKPSGPRTAPPSNDVSKALKRPRSLRYIPQSEPLNLFRQADQPDPLMPPFEYEPPTTPYSKLASSILYKELELSSAEKKNSGPPTTDPGRKSGSSTIHEQSRPRTAPPKQHDSSKAHNQPGSWRRHLSQSGLLTATGEPGSSTAQPEAPAQPGLLAALAEAEAYRRWWNDDGHDDSDKGR